MKHTNIILILATLFVCSGFSKDGRTIGLERMIIQRDFAQAVVTAENLLGQELSEREELKVKYFLAVSLLQLKRFEPAQKLFQEISKNKKVQLYRDKAYLGLLNTYYFQDDYNEALKVGRKLIKRNQGSDILSLIYLNYARINLRLANWDEAHLYLKKIIQDHPQSLEVPSARQLLEEKQYFAVQVGSFMERKRAEKLVQELKTKDEYAYIIETLSRSNKIFFRVRVGQLSVLDEAKMLKTKLAQQGYPTKIYP